MKTIIEFNLPEDRVDLNIHVMADGMYGALWDIARELRKYRKYDESLTSEQRDFVCKFEEHFYNLLSKHFVDLDRIP